MLKCSKLRKVEVASHDCDAGVDVLPQLTSNKVARSMRPILNVKRLGNVNRTHNARGQSEFF